MHPVIVKLGPLTIYSYGLLVALGFIIATFLAAKQAARINVPEDKVTTLSLLILISGIIGARACYILLNIKDYIANPVEIIMLMHGGLVFYGGAIFASIAAVVYIKISGLSIPGTADLLSPYIALGHSIGRIGCFLNGCCYGKPASGPFTAVFQDGIPRIPTQIYSSLLLLLLFIFLRVCFKYRKFKGQVFFSYLIFYSAGRIFIENFRGDNTPVILNLTFSQLISAGMFIIGIAGYFIAKEIQWKKAR